MKEFLMIMGVIALFVLAALAVIFLKDGIGILIENLKLKYRQKHRFDKAPTAKCYCIDCVYHNNETGLCCKFETWNTADNWFCWNAEPRKTEEEAEKALYSNTVN